MKSIKISLSQKKVTIRIKSKMRGEICFELSYFSQETTLIGNSDNK